jgi:hypothetical protein
MLINTLIETIKEDYLNDDVPDYLWSDKSLLRKLSEAQRQACNRADLIFDNSNSFYVRFTLVENRSSYTFDQKLTRIDRVSINGVAMIKLTREAFNNLDAALPGMAGKDLYYCITGRTINVYPAPNAIDAGSYLQLEAYRLPDVDIESTSDELEIPEENHRDLIWWVLHECFNKPDIDIFNQEKQYKYLQKFEEVFGSYVSARVRQHQFENPLSSNITPQSNIKNYQREDYDNNPHSDSW